MVKLLLSFESVRERVRALRHSSGGHVVRDHLLLTVTPGVCGGQLPACFSTKEHSLKEQFLKE